MQQLLHGGQSGPNVAAASNPYAIHGATMEGPYHRLALASATASAAGSSAPPSSVLKSTPPPVSQDLGHCGQVKEQVTSGIPSSTMTSANVTSVSSSSPVDQQSVISHSNSSIIVGLWRANLLLDTLFEYLLITKNKVAYK